MNPCWAAAVLTEVEAWHGALSQLRSIGYSSTKFRSGAHTSAWSHRPGVSVLKIDRTGEGLRRLHQSAAAATFFDIGGHLELFGTVRSIVVARPERQTWNTMVLTALWANIGEHGPGRW